MFDLSRPNTWTQIMIVVVLLALTTGNAFGDDTSVKQLTVVGTSVARSNNPTNARQNAVEDALNAALGQAVMEMLTNETVVRRFQLINDNILSRRDAYIRNYQVLTESLGHKTAKVLVRVDIATERLSNDLAGIGLALSGTVYPRVAFIVAEKNLNGDPVFWWGNRVQDSRTISEAAMATALEGAGFEIVAPPSLSGPLNLSQTLSQADILALGNRLGADIVVVGSSVANPASNTMAGSLQAFQAKVSVEALNVQSGKTMGRTKQSAVVSAQNTSTGGHNALTDAGTSAGEALARQVMSAWLQNQEGSAVIEVQVEGTSGQIASFVKLRTAITSLSGVKDVKMKEMGTDQATMAVNYQGSTRSMADALLLKTFSGFGIDIYEVSDQDIRIRLIGN